MIGFDYFVSEVFEEGIKKKLGTRSFNKIKNRLLDKYGMSVTMAIRDFEKMDLVLREYFGPTTDKIIKDVLKQIISLNREDTTHPLTIKDDRLIDKILLSYGDSHKKEILDILFEKPMIILDLLKKTDIPQATVYRRFKELIQDGLLVEKNYELTSDGKKISVYAPLLEKMDLKISGSKTDLNIKIKEQFIKNSVYYNVFSKK